MKSVQKTADYPLYTIHFPKHWMLKDEPKKKVYFSCFLDDKKEKEEEEKTNRAELLFHVASGEYLSTLAGMLRFFEEAIEYDRLSPELKETELKVINKVIDNLLYLEENYDLTPKTHNKN